MVGFHQSISQSYLTSSSSGNSWVEPDSSSHNQHQALHHQTAGPFCHFDCILCKVAPKSQDSVLKGWMTHLHSVNVWRGLWSLQSNYFLPGLQQVPFEMFLIQHISHNQDENYLLSHILGLAALSLLRVSNTIGNDNIVKVCFWDIQHPTEIQLDLPTSTSFSGLWGRRGGAHPVLESRRELRQEGRGPRGDGPHCGIGPSLFGPILSNKWPWFWSRRLLNKF